jgi:hypothetical protein
MIKAMLTVCCGAGDPGLPAAAAQEGGDVACSSQEALVQYLETDGELMPDGCHPMNVAVLEHEGRQLCALDVTRPQEGFVGETIGRALPDAMVDRLRRARGAAVDLGPAERAAALASVSGRAKEGAGAARAGGEDLSHAAGSARPSKCASRLSTASMPIAVRVSSVAEPMCGSRVTLSSCHELGRHLRLLGVDVEAGAGDAAVAQGGDEGGLVDDVAAGGVHEIGRRLHQRDPGGGDDAAVGAAAGDVQRDDVGLREAPPPSWSRREAGKSRIGTSSGCSRSRSCRRRGARGGRSPGRSGPCRRCRSSCPAAPCRATASRGSRPMRRGGAPSRSRGSAGSRRASARWRGRRWRRSARPACSRRRRRPRAPRRGRCCSRRRRSSPRSAAFAGRRKQRAVDRVGHVVSTPSA